MTSDLDDQELEDALAAIKREGDVKARGKSEGL
jgi:hypothetical protein